jgi:hypothetical protein
MVFYLTEMMKIHHQMLVTQEKEIIELKTAIRLLTSGSDQEGTP